MSTLLRRTGDMVFEFEQDKPRELRLVAAWLKGAWYQYAINRHGIREWTPVEDRTLIERLNAASIQAPRSKP